MELYYWIGLNWPFFKGMNLSVKTFGLVVSEELGPFWAFSDDCYRVFDGLSPLIDHYAICVTT